MLFYEIWSKCIQFYHQKRDVRMQTERVYHSRFAVNLNDRVQSINNRKWNFHAHLGLAFRFLEFFELMHESFRAMKLNRGLASGYWQMFECQMFNNHSFLYIYLFLSACQRWMAFEQWTMFRVPILSAKRYSFSLFTN